MQKMYSYNPGTKALHILGLCTNSDGYDYRYFDSVSEAISSSGGQIFFCKVCEKERDKILKKAMEIKLSEQ